MARTLWNIYESDRQGMTAKLLEDFKQKAASDGTSPTAALVRIIRRYLTRGFDDQASAAEPRDAKPTRDGQ